MRPVTPWSGFTFIELLVTISIMALLSGMLFATLGLAKRKSKQTATMAVMAKAEAAIRTFRIEMRVYPRQTDLSTADVDPTKWTNNLGYRLAYTPATAADAATDAANLQADIAAVRNAFYFVDGTKVGMGAPPTFDGTHVFRSPDPYKAGYITNILLNPGTLVRPDSHFTTLNGGAQGYIPSAGSATAMSQVLSSLAEEQCVLKLMAGQIPLLAPVGIDPNDAQDKADFPSEDSRYTILNYQGGSPVTAFPFYRYVPYNRGTDVRGPVLTTATAKTRGFRIDFLSTVLKRQSSPSSTGGIDPTGEAVIDAWGNPIVYICDVDPRMRGFFNAMTNGIYGDAARYRMDGSGRRVTTVLASDLRTTAAAAFRYEFELWSAGPDGKFSHMRDSPDSKDNIPYLSYNRGLQ